MSDKPNIPDGFIPIEPDEAMPDTPTAKARWVLIGTSENFV